MTDRVVRSHRPGINVEKSPRSLLAEMRHFSEQVQQLNRDCRAELNRAMRRRDEAICEAAAKGVTLDQLVEATTLSRVRLKAIVKEDRWR